MLLLLGFRPRRTVFRGMPAVVRLRRLVNTTVPIATMSMLRIVSRITGSLNASSRQSRRISSGLSQHCFQLRLGDLPRLPHSWLARRRYPIHRAGTGGQQRWLPLRHRPYLGFCGWRLVTALQAQTSQLGADRVTAIPETTRDLRGALSYGPEFFEQCYVFRIPTHGRYYTRTIKYWLVVRFTPTSGHRQLDYSGPKSANTGSAQAYSITSSALASSVGGMVRPIALHRGASYHLFAFGRSTRFSRNSFRHSVCRK
jgi:hypothetical protein